MKALAGPEPRELAPVDPAALERDVEAIWGRVTKVLEEIDRRRRSFVGLATTVRRCTLAVALLGLAWLLVQRRPRAFVLRR